MTLSEFARCGRSLKPYLQAHRAGAAAGAADERARGAGGGSQPISISHKDWSKKCSVSCLNLSLSRSDLSYKAPSGIRLTRYGFIFFISYSLLNTTRTRYTRARPKIPKYLRMAHTVTQGMDTNWFVPGFLLPLQASKLFRGRAGGRAAACSGGGTPPAALVPAAAASSCRVDASLPPAAECRRG